MWKGHFTNSFCGSLGFDKEIGHRVLLHFNWYSCTSHCLIAENTLTISQLVQENLGFVTILSSVLYHNFSWKENVKVDKFILASVLLCCTSLQCIDFM